MLQIFNRSDQQAVQQNACQHHHVCLPTTRQNVCLPITHQKLCSHLTSPCAFSITVLGYLFRSAGCAYLMPSSNMTKSSFESSRKRHNDLHINRVCDGVAVFASTCCAASLCSRSQSIKKMCPVFSTCAALFLSYLSTGDFAAQSCQAVRLH